LTLLFSHFTDTTNEAWEVTQLGPDHKADKIQMEFREERRLWSPG